MSASHRRPSNEKSTLLFSTTIKGAIGAAVVLLPQAQAATFTVTNLDDLGAGSLRQAIDDANNAAGPDVITFQAGLSGTIVLGSQLKLGDSVDIQGPGASTLTISGNSATRVFYVYNASTLIDVTLSGLTIANGTANLGAGIYDIDENLTLDGVTITNCAATGNGGGLYLDGFNFSATVRNSVITGNAAANKGGGIYTEDTGPNGVTLDRTLITGNTAARGGGVYFYDPDGVITIVDTTISTNHASNRGGGLFLADTDSSGTVTISRSTISGNTADGKGGGVYLYQPDNPFVIENTTISGNTAGAGGGGIYLYDAANTTFDVRNTTLAGNTATGGSGEALFVKQGTVTLRHDIFAGGTAELGGGGTFDAAYTLFQAPGATPYVDNGNNQSGVDPQLGPLGNNGGPTQTHLLALASPAVNAGAALKSPVVDQRGNARVVGPTADLGAVELAPGTVQFTAATATVNETAGTVTLTLARSGGTDGPLSVNYQMTPGTAGITDYTDASGMVTWADGDATDKTIVVAITNDTLIEPDETFTVAISATPASVLGAQTNVVVTIQSDDVPVPGTASFSVATSSVNENAGTASITVTRGGGSDGAVSVHYATADGSANAGSDYTATSGTLTWNDGDATSRTILVPITNDTLVEAPESFVVNLDTPQGGMTLGNPASTTITIQSDDVAVAGAVAFDAATASINENAGTASINVTRSGGSDGAVSVHYATADGSATAGSDYTATTGTLTWNDGDATSRTIVVPITDDALVEAPESFVVNLDTPQGGVALGNPASTTVTIQSDDVAVAGTVSFDVATSTVNENAGTATISVTRSGGSDGAVSVNYTTANGSAIAGGDYTATSGTLTWADGDATPRTIVVPIVNDAAVEPSETFIVTLDTPQGGVTLGTATHAVTITDDDVAAPVQAVPVPALDAVGRGLLGGLLAACAWMGLRRRKHRGGGAAALLLGAALALPGTHADAAQANRAAAKAAPTFTAGTLTRIERGSEIVLHLANGTVLRAGSAGVEVADQRKAVAAANRAHDAATLSAGQFVVVKQRDESRKAMKVMVYDSAAEAEAAAATRRQRHGQ
jgi:hypothetical protein